MKTFKKFAAGTMAAATFFGGSLASAPASAVTETLDFGFFEITFKVCREVEIEPGVDGYVCQDVTV